MENQTAIYIEIKCGFFRRVLGKILTFFLKPYIVLKGYK